MKLSWRISRGLIGGLAAAVILVLAATVALGCGGDGGVSGDDHDGLTAHDDGHIVGGAHDGATGHDDGHVLGADHDGATGHDDGHTVDGDHDGATAHDDLHEEGDSHDGDTKHDDNHTSFGPSGGGHNGVSSHDDRHEKGDNHDGDTDHDDDHIAGGGHDGATAHDDGHIFGGDHDGATAHDDGHIASGEHDGATAHDDDHTSSAHAAATPEVTAEPTPGVTAEPTPPASEPAVDAAMAAALEYYDAVSDADCYTNNPQNKQCAGLSSQPSTVQGGIAVFGVASPDGPGFVAVLGRDPAGEWKFWRAGQQDYQLLTLPGDALVCAYGSRLNVRSAPTTDAPAVGVLEDLTGVRAEEFVLTVPGELQFGYGWFRLSSPLDGWVYSKYLTAALWDDCALHDALEPEL